MLQQQPPGLQRCQLESVSLDASSTPPIYPSDMGNMATNHVLFCSLEGLNTWAVLGQEQSLLMQSFGHMILRVISQGHQEKNQQRADGASCLHN